MSNNQTLTALETSIVQGFLASEYGDGGVHSVVWTFSIFNGVNPKQGRGAVSSLIKKGLARVSQIEPGANGQAFSLTDEGKALVQTEILKSPPVEASPVKVTEKAILSDLITSLKSAGFVPVNVWDGGEYVDATTLDQVWDAVDSVDESTIHFARVEEPTKWGRLGVLCVSGNGCDIISDYHCGDPKFSAAIDAVGQRALEIS